MLVSQRPELRPLDERLQELTEQWRQGTIDNYTYLLRLNDCASRSFADLSQYPIMCADGRVYWDKLTGSLLRQVT